MKRNQYQRGELVTCRHPVQAYYSDYSGNPQWWFRPGMVGLVAHIAPKVRIVGEPPVYDQRDEFVVVDYVDPADGITRRAGLNFCNITRVTDGNKVSEGKTEAHARH